MSIQQRHRHGNRRPGRASGDEAIARFDQELEGLLRFPSDQEQHRAGDLLCAKGRLLRFWGYMDQAIAVFESGKTIPAFKRDPLFRARLRAELGLTHVQTSDYPRAKRELQGSRIVIRQKAEDSPLLASILNGLGMCAWGEGNYRKARRLYQETLEVSQAAKFEELEAKVRNNLGLLEWRAGRLEAALEHYKVCLRRWKKLRNHFGRALALMNMGIIEENMGRLTLARRHYREALALAEEVGYLQVQAACHINLGNLALGKRDRSQALDYCRRALEIAREIGDRRSQAIALENMALAYLSLNEPRRFNRAIRDGRRIARAIGDQERLFTLELVEIEAGLAQRKLGGLTERIHKARQRLEKQSYLAELPRLLRLQIQMELLGGKKGKARRTISRALRECRKQKNRLEGKRIQALKKGLNT